MTQGNNKEQGNSPEKRLNIKEAAIYLGISTSTLRKLCYEKKIPYYKPLKSLEFKPSDLETWRESSRIEPETTPQPTM